VGQLLMTQRMGTSGVISHQVKMKNGILNNVRIPATIRAWDHFKSHKNFNNTRKKKRITRYGEM
jgi:hypothetical protein